MNYPFKFKSEWVAYYDVNLTFKELWRLHSKKAVAEQIINKMTITRGFKETAERLKKQL